jgi:UDP-2,3-diacylglucosamine hydrolase
MIEIKDGALFISDAHDNEKRKGFYNFLQKLDRGEIKTNQLFFMGDMFDLLVGEVSYTNSFFKNSIDLINRLSSKIEIIYLEGNHDFRIQTVFPDVKVYPISKQPLLCSYHNRYILLSHGDFHQGRNYMFYTMLIRNKILLMVLNIIDKVLNNYISKKILLNQISKNKCYEITHFDQFIKQKIKKYDIEITEIDFVCEGHHHQDKEFIFDRFKYINFSSFACDKSYYQITFKDEIKFIKFS